MATTVIDSSWLPSNGFASWLPAAAATAVTSPDADRRLWDERMAAYLRADALFRAVQSFGLMAEMDQDSSLEDYKLECRYGAGFRSHPEVRPRLRKRYREHELIEARLVRDYSEPLWQAIRDLVDTPVPDLAAALFKIELIEREDVKLDADFKRDVFEVVAEDIASLTG